MARIIAVWLLGAIFACFPMSVGAQEACNKPLQVFVHLPMTAMGTVRTVPIAVNGVTKQFVVDTGGFYPQVSTGVANELKLSRKDSLIQLYEVGGSVSKYYTNAEVGIGAVKLPNLELIISDLGDLDGIFPPTAFKDLDFDFDFAGGKLNLVSKNHCDGKVIYWPAKTIAVVPFRQDESQHITVTVTVDGQPMIAIIDTGASNTIMSLDAARLKFGLTADSPDMKAEGNIGFGLGAATYRHSFKSLSFDGITVTNPDILIAADVMGAKADHANTVGSHINKDSDALALPQLTVGMDVLGKLHIYLAQAEKRLYLTEASTPAAN